VLKIVAYYTNDFYYSKSIDLSHSLNKFGACYEIKKVQGPETWNEAVSYKPRFILDSLLSSSCQYLGYTDCDSRLLRALPASDITGDVAYVPFKRNPHSTEEALTGTLFFKNTTPVKAFVMGWIDATTQWQGLDTPEQLSLKQVLEHTNLNVQRLGPEWCFIFDDMREMYPDAAPIFEHYQASREYKELEAKGTHTKAQVPDMQGERGAAGPVGDPSEWTRSKGSSK
jgi:hypothetical protein